MIISRTPLRVSFLGGGTDYPQWYIEHDGAVLGATINKFCYVMLHDGRSWKTFDLPTKAGLASSSAYTVGLLRVCTELDKITIGKLATTWEQDKMNGYVGSQDQYLCSMGGFHLLKFYEYGIKDMAIAPELVEPLQKYLMLFDTHQYRLAGNVVAHQLSEMKKHKALFARMTEMVNDGLRLIVNADYIGFGKLLGESWLIKRQLSKYISTAPIDKIYESALQAGAVGGKLLGAGGGGFMLLFAEPDRQENIKRTLDDLTYVSFQFEWEGTKIIYHD